MNYECQVKINLTYTFRLTRTILVSLSILYMQPYQKFIIPIIFTVVTLFNTAHAKDGAYVSALGGLTFKNISTQKSTTGTTNKYIL